MTLVSFASLPLEDVRALADLERRVFERVDHYDAAPWTTANFEAPLPDKLMLSFVARANGEVVGFLVASRRAGGDVRLHRLAVDPDQGGSGWGAALIARLLESTSGPISVSCHPANTRALALYRSFGFGSQTGQVDGKLVLHLPARDGVRMWYIYNTISMATGHASHVPRLLDAMAAHGSVSGIGYGTDDLPPFSIGVQWIAAFARLLRRARSERVRVVFVRIHWPLAALFRIAGSVLGWRVVVWSSGAVGPALDTRVSARVRAQRSMFTTVLRRLVDGVATGPPAVAMDYVRRYRIRPEKVVLVANDVDVARWADVGGAGEDPAARPAGTAEWFEARYRVLYAHGLDRLRGADRLPELAADLAERLPGAVVLAVGHGSLRASLSSAPHIVAPGAVSNDTIALLLRHAHAVLVPSRQEGFPRVVLEALAAGCPPVCTDVGGCRDIVGPDLAGLLVADSVADMITLAVGWCTTHASDEALHRALIGRAREFDTSVVARRLTAALGVLGVAGTSAAHRVSWAGWHDVFARTP